MHFHLGKEIFIFFHNFDKYELALSFDWSKKSRDRSKRIVWLKNVGREPKKKFIYCTTILYWNSPATIGIF